jgi:hypothetical protein
MVFLGKFTLWYSNQNKTPIERFRSIGCPLSFVRRSLPSNKKRVYISTTGETQKEALRTCNTTDYGQLATDV